MTNASTSGRMKEACHAELTRSVEQQHVRQQDIWEQSAPKRELAEHLRKRLIGNDDEILKLMKTADDISIRMAKGGPLGPRDPDKPPRPRPSIDIELTPKFPLNWTWTSQGIPGGYGAWSENVMTDPIPTVSSPWVGEIMLNLSTVNLAGNPPTETAAAAIGASVQAPRDSTIIVTSNPTIDYRYGNSAFLAHSHTHAWIGIVVQQDMPDGSVENLVLQKINLWDMDTDHDFSGSSTPSLYAYTPVVAGARYVIWIWIGGDVESNYISYGFLQVHVKTISVAFT